MQMKSAVIRSCACASCVRGAPFFFDSPRRRAAKDKEGRKGKERDRGGGGKGKRRRRREGGLLRAVTGGGVAEEGEGSSGVGDSQSPAAPRRVELASWYNSRRQTFFFSHYPRTDFLHSHNFSTERRVSVGMWTLWRRSRRRWYDAESLPCSSWPEFWSLWGVSVKIKAGKT